MYAWVKTVSVSNVNRFGNVTNTSRESPSKWFGGRGGRFVQNAAENPPSGQCKPTCNLATTVSLCICFAII